MVCSNTYSAMLTVVPASVDSSKSLILCVVSLFSTGINCPDEKKSPLGYLSNALSSGDANGFYFNHKSGLAQAMAWHREANPHPIKIDSVYEELLIYILDGESIWVNYDII